MNESVAPSSADGDSRVGTGGGRSRMDCTTRIGHYSSKRRCLSDVSLSALTHSLTHSLTHPLSHSLTLSLTHSLTLSLSQLSRSLTHSRNSLARSPTHATLTHSTLTLSLSLMLDTLLLPQVFGLLDCSFFLSFSRSRNVRVVCG